MKCPNCGSEMTASTLRYARYHCRSVCGLAGPREAIEALAARLVERVRIVESDDGDITVYTFSADKLDGGRSARRASVTFSWDASYEPVYSQTDEVSGACQIEPLHRHEAHGALRRALKFTSDAKDKP